MEQALETALRLRPGLYAAAVRSRRQERSPFCRDAASGESAGAFWSRWQEYRELREVGEAGANGGGQHHWDFWGRNRSWEPGRELTDLRRGRIRTRGVWGLEDFGGNN